MHRFFSLIAGAAASLLALGASGQASAALLTVDGVIDSSFLINSSASSTFGFGQAVAITFVLDHDATGVTFTAALDCSSCTGSLFLNSGIAGPSVPTGALLASGVFDSTSNSLFESNVNNVLDFGGQTSFDLAAGTYSFGVIITDDQASWFTSSMATTIASSGASCAFSQFSADANPTFAPRNNFSIINNCAGDALLFSIDGMFASSTPPSQVPLPGAIAVMATGLASICGLARRRKRSKLSGRSVH